MLFLAAIVVACGGGFRCAPGASGYYLSGKHADRLLHPAGGHEPLHCQLSFQPPAARALRGVRSVHDRVTYRPDVDHLRTVVQHGVDPIGEIQD